jgi:hypothetical protein
MINVQGVDMFDSNDNNQQDQTTDSSAAPATDIFSGSVGAPTSPSDSATTDSSSTPFGAPNTPTSDDSTTPTDNEAPDATASPAVETPAASDTEAAPEEDASSPATPTDSDDADQDAVMKTAPSEDLSAMKQEALGHLQPLVAHLDLNPEEEFRTTMMMIQANDDQSLLSKAFEAAKKITDDKARAQALLDVINEINYFTQHAE